MRALRICVPRFGARMGIILRSPRVFCRDRESEQKPNKTNNTFILDMSNPEEKWPSYIFNDRKNGTFIKTET